MSVKVFQMKFNTTVRPFSWSLALAIIGTLSPRIALPGTTTFVDITSDQFKEAFGATAIENAILRDGTAFVTGTLPAVCAGYFDITTSTSNPGSTSPIIAETDGDGNKFKTAWIKIGVAAGGIECVKTRKPDKCEWDGENATCLKLSELTRVHLRELNQNVKLALISVDPNTVPAASPITLTDLGIEYLTPAAAHHLAVTQAAHDKKTAIASNQEFLRDTAGQPECKAERASAIASLVELGVDTADIEADLKLADLQATLDELLAEADEAVETREIEKAAKKLYDWAKKREHKAFAVRWRRS